MKVGILIKKPENIFSNGCIQQTYFLKKLFDNLGYDVSLLSIEIEYTHFDMTNEPIIFTNDKYDFSSYNCIMLGSLILLPESNQAYIDNIKSYDISIINLICGNVFILHQEEFVFNTHKIIKNYKQNYFTQNWVLEMYDYSLDYIRMLSGCDTKITPYVWDIDIVKEYVEKNNIHPKMITEDNSKINLLLFEPNMSIHKNSLVPLLICDEYYKRNKDYVNKVYVFCGDNVINNNNIGFLQNLDIYLDGKIETYGRIIMPYIMDVIQKNNPFMNIVVSYNLLNNLNFLHLEMFYLGFPIVHNCKPFEQNGMFFENFELMKAVDIIEHTRTHFNREEYIKCCKPILETFSPKNKERLSKYKLLFEQFVKINKEEGSLLSTSSITETSKIMPTDYIDENMFYQGSGYVVFIEKNQEVPKLKMLYDMITAKKELSRLEIFFEEKVAIRTDDLLFNEFVSTNLISLNSKIDKTYTIRNSSFREVKYININSISMDDIEIYTK
jgi:hypothetical protein